MTTSIHSILFDFGGVFTASPFNFVAQYANKLGADPLLLGRLIFGDYHRDTDHPWHRLERGELSLDDAGTEIADLGSQAGLNLNLLEVFESFPRDGGLREEFIAKARSLRDAGYKLAVVTNNIAEYNEGWRSLFEVDDIFDTIIDSSVEGVRKPDPAIYHRALFQLSCPAPWQAVFLDDFDGNLSAAAELGMHTVLVGEDGPAALQELDRILAAPAVRPNGNGAV